REMSASRQNGRLRTGPMSTIVLRRLLGRGVRRSLILALLLVALLGLPGATPASLDFRIHQAASGETFNPFFWMLGAGAERAGAALASLLAGPGSAAGVESDPGADAALVRRYLASNGDDPALRDEAERILQRQIAQSLGDLDLEWPVLGAERVFP